MNQTIIEQVAAQAATEAGKLGQKPTIPPEVVAAPIRTESANIAPIAPTLTSFFGPAVLALILQHMAVTLTALSLVRERHTGVFDVLRISPVSASEIVVGKVLAFGILGALVAAAVLQLLAAGLGVPFLGDPLLVVAADRPPARRLALASACSSPSCPIRNARRSSSPCSSCSGRCSSAASCSISPSSRRPCRSSATCCRSPTASPCSRTCSCAARRSDTWRLGVLAAISLVTVGITWLVLRRGMSARA